MFINTQFGNNKIIVDESIGIVNEIFQKLTQPNSYRKKKKNHIKADIKYKHSNSDDTKYVKNQKTYSLVT